MRWRIAIAAIALVLGTQVRSSDLLDVLSVISTRANVAIAVDQDVDLTAIAPSPALENADSVASLNAVLIHHGLIAVAVDPSLWRIAVDPLPTYPLGKKEVLLASQTVVTPAAVAFVEETGAIGHNRVDRVIALTGNLYGAGERLYSRGIPRNRWQSDRDDVAVYWNGIPLPDFVLQESDFALAGHSANATRGPDYQQSLPVTAYAGSIKLESQLPASFTEGSASDLGEFTAGAGWSETWGSSRAGVLAQRSKRANPSPAVEADQGHSQTDQVSGSVLWSAAAVDAGMRFLLLDTDASPRTWNVYADEDYEIAVPHRVSSTTQVRALQGYANLYTDDGATIALELGAMDAHGEYIASNNAYRTEAERDHRRSWQIGLSYADAFGDRSDFGLGLTASNITDQASDLSMESLWNHPLVQADFLEPVSSSTDYLYGTENRVSGDYEQVAAHAWWETQWSDVTLRGSLRVEKPELTTVGNTLRAFEGDSACQARSLLAFQASGLALLENETISCRNLASRLSGVRPNPGLQSTSTPLLTTADVSLDWRVQPGHTLSARAYNRRRPGGLVKDSTRAVSFFNVGNERLMGLEFGYHFAGQSIRNKAVVFYLDMDQRSLRTNTTTGLSGPDELWNWVAGIEVDGSWELTDSQSLLWSLGYLKSSSEATRPPTGAPTWTGSVRYQASLGRHTLLESSVLFSSESEREEFTPVLARQTDFVRLDLSLLRQWRALETGISLRNVTDTRYVGTTFDKTGATGLGVRYGRPRSIEAWVRWTF